MINGVLKTTYSTNSMDKAKLGAYHHYATSTPPAVTLRMHNSQPIKSYSPELYAPSVGTTASHPLSATKVVNLLGS